ncbi:RHS repeat-associated core domain-containing protein, partial [Streptomyces sp. B1866]|uniref:RHS repeat-associated core domain-containing protein n=1 Tax=Streptomyces sp. B1866 TaxID=3075431 RepID=UPI00288ECEA3
AGNPTELHTDAGTLTFTYDAAGRETERRLGEQVTLTQTWDQTDRLTSQTLTHHTGGAEAARLLQHRAYAYRPDGHLTEIRELTSGTRRFDLTPTGRVTTVHAHGWTETYAYDPTGNLTHATAPAHPAPGDRHHTGTILHRAGRTTHEHDAEGRLTRRTRRLLNGKTHTWTFTWNAEDRLTEAVTPDGEHWHYTYDPLGRRTTKHRLAEDGTPADTTTFTWDGTRLAEETAPDGRTTTWNYAPDTHRPLTQTTHHPSTHNPEESLLTKFTAPTDAPGPTRFHAVITDLVGTPTELVTAEGDLAWQHRTTLWGTPLPAPPGAADCPFRFPGQYHDPETGLHYNHHRYYDPETARYISPDPLGLEPAPNHFSYVHNPHTRADPWGLYDCKKLNKIADREISRAVSGSRRTAGGYHGHLSKERELEILANPDGVYVSHGGAERLIFHQGEDIVVMESKGSKAGNVITSYGPSGPKNASGAAAWGGSPNDPGPPVTREQIIKGQIPTPSGGTLPPATPIR